MAEVKFDSDNSHKLARLHVGTDWKSVPVDDENLELTALHEVLHVFFHELIEACREEPYNTARQTEKEHECLIVLEKLLYELWHQKHVELLEELPVHRPKQRKAKPH